jgi:outer membrane biosynthesis protein TonB
MGRLSASLLALALGAIASLGLVACGSSGGANLLPGSTASEINANLDQVEQLANEGDCVGAADSAQAVSAQIGALGGVDAKLKQALREGATRLNEVVASCEETAAEEEVAPAIEPPEAPAEAEKKEEKEKPAKPVKPEKEVEEAPEEAPAPTLPPQAKGEAKGHEEEVEAPPAEPEGSPSGGVGPATPAGSP